MKVKVLKDYVDRETKEMRKSGRICNYPRERAKELESRGYVELMKENRQGGENDGL